MNDLYGNANISNVSKRLNALNRRCPLDLNIVNVTLANSMKESHNPTLRSTTSNQNSCETRSSLKRSTSYSSKSQRFQAIAARNFLSQIAESQRNKNVENPALSFPENMTVAEALSLLHVTELSNDIEEIADKSQDEVSKKLSAEMLNGHNKDIYLITDYNSSCISTKNTSSRSILISDDQNLRNCQIEENTQNILEKSDDVSRSDYTIEVHQLSPLPAVDDLSQNNNIPIEQKNSRDIESENSDSAYLKNPFVFIPNFKAEITFSSGDVKSVESLSSSSYTSNYRLPMSAYLSPLFLFPHQLQSSVENMDNQDIICVSSPSTSCTSDSVLEISSSKGLRNKHAFLKDEIIKMQGNPIDEIKPSEKKCSKNTAKRNRKQEAALNLNNEQSTTKRVKYNNANYCNIDPSRIVRIVRTDLIAKNKTDQSKVVEKNHDDLQIPFSLSTRTSRMHSKPIMSGNEILENLKKEEMPPLQLPIKQQPTVRQVIVKQIQSSNPEIAQMLTQKGSQKLGRYSNLTDINELAKPVKFTSNMEQREKSRQEDMKCEKIHEIDVHFWQKIGIDTEIVDKHTTLREAIELIHSSDFKNEEKSTIKTLNMDIAVKSYINKNQNESSIFENGRPFLDMETQHICTKEEEKDAISAEDKNMNNEFSLTMPLTTQFDTHVIQLIT